MPEISLTNSLRGWSATCPQCHMSTRSTRLEAVERWARAHSLAHATVAHSVTMTPARTLGWDVMCTCGASARRSCQADAIDWREDHIRAVGERASALPPALRRVPTVGQAG